MSDQREVNESPLDQGTHEARAYSFDFSAAGVTTIAGTPSVALYDWTANPPIDVSASLLSGTSAPAVGLIATMSGKVQTLVDGKEYRLFCRVVHDGSQTSELYCRLLAKV